MRKKIYFVLILTCALLPSCTNKKENSNPPVDSVSEIMENNSESPVTSLKSENGLNLVVDFSATWCGPCQQLKPIFEEVEKEFSGKVDFLTVDIDSMPDLAKEFKVEAVPTIVFIDKSGREVNRIVGFTDKSQLVETIQKMQ